MPPSASQEKAERLLNLVMTLRATRRPLSKEQLRDTIPQYRDVTTAEAFDRMFERDKDELRDLGIPVSTASLDVWHDDLVGYRIDASDYELPEVHFEPDEMAALSVAARTWSQASFSGPAAGALRKLRSAGVEVDDDAMSGIQPRVPTREPAFSKVSEAAMARQVIRFDYRRADGTVATRKVQPWVVKFWHGRWYLTAMDLDRDDERVFRLDRITGPVRTVGKTGAYEVPEDHVARISIERVVGDTDRVRALVRVRAGAGHGLRRSAGAAPVAQLDAHPVPDDSWDLLEIDGHARTLAGEIAALGDDAVVLEPEDLRTDVLERLQSVHAATSEVLDALPAVDGDGAGEPAGDADEAPVSRRRPPVIPESATSRVARMLTMVPWLLEHPGSPLGDVAERFGLTEEALVADLELLFLCGPGQYPDELVDASWDGGIVTVSNADAIARPLRLARDEAVTLIAGLQALRGIPGVGDVVQRTMDKLRVAVGEEASAARTFDVAVDEDDIDKELLRDINDALDRARRVEMTYYVPGRDESTQRQVDPMRLVVLDGRYYLEGWCHRAREVRIFRADRIESLTVLDEDGTPPASARPRDLAAPIYVPGEDDHVVVLRVEPVARWVIDYYQPEEASELADGAMRVVLRVADPTMIRRMVLRQGAAVLVTSPASLVETVRDVAARAVEGYAAG